VSAEAKFLPTIERLHRLLANCELQLRSGPVSAKTLRMIADTEQAIVECLQSLERQSRPQPASKSAIALKRIASNVTPRDLMFPQAARRAFDRPGWIFEMKYDGLRVLAVRESGRARLLSRSGVNLGPAFPEVVESVLKLPETVLDGELVVLDSQGKAQFEKVHARSLAHTPSSVKRAMSVGLADLLAFDVLKLRGKDLRAIPLLTRKRVLQQMLEGFQRVRPMQYVHEHGKRLFAAARDLDIAGIVAKRADAPYSAGRSRDWLTIRRPVGARSAKKRATA
jgi:ATP-dependent DNA ligase